MPRIPVSAQGAQIGVLAGISSILIYQHFSPNLADLRTVTPFNLEAEKSEREALFVSIGVAAVVATTVKSWDTFLVAGAIIIGVDFASKHANAVNPSSGKMQSPNANGMETGDMNLPDYSQNDAA